MRSLVVPLSAPEPADAARFGPKAANLAALGRAGLPTPGGYAVDAQAYRTQLATLGLDETARRVFSTEDRPQARRHALDMKLGLMERPVAPGLSGPLLAAWRAVPGSGAQGVVRSSALVEDRTDSSFAGQFESFLELQNEAEFLTAVRACWAALWSTRALRYMATHGLAAADTAMALIVQPLVAAHVSGGGLSRTVDGDRVINAAWGLGSAIAQGEVAPDRYVLDLAGNLKESTLGRKYHGMGCAHGRAALSRSLAGSRCLDDEQIAELGLMMHKAEEVIGEPVEIEWAMDETGIKLLQARPLHVGEPRAETQLRDEIWLAHPRLNGHPSGIGWGTGRARVVNCECELERVAPGDVLVTTVAGSALGGGVAPVGRVVAGPGGRASPLPSPSRGR